MITVVIRVCQNKKKIYIFLVLAAKITAGERGSVISVQSPVGGEWEHCDLLMLLLRETNYMSMLWSGRVCG